MKILFFSALLLLSGAAVGQIDATDAEDVPAYASTSVTVSVSAIDFAGAKAKVNLLIGEQHIKVLRQDEGLKSLTVEANFNSDQYRQFELMLGTLGKVLSKEVNASNGEERMQEFKLEGQHLQQKRESCAKMMAKVDSTSESFLTLWQELKGIDEQIYENSKSQLGLSKKGDGYLVNLSVNDEVTTPDNTRIAFVNMPGFQYSYLFIESPKQGVSYDHYQGYFLKYLFTRGKSFVYTGAYKSVGASQDDLTAYSEMFLFGFGQDFYTRHFGRGDRRFLNLYSGYNLGYVYATGKDSKSNFCYVAPSVGVELFKNKYVLVDTKASYFIPFSHNKELRGLSLDASFNFIF
ncbi:hypothetical protein [uncultured Acetobacteroides sp.]|uniref:hypothetical protein n=1 Tax=uncultured Acetobacteroides sp. TaxID=1760811 RepID=UPI0029F52DF5|nr:hypothetical protein [uncultured Acetobacteroides sp.]